MRMPLIRTLLASALALGVAAGAHALPILRLTTSGGSVTVADGGASDIDPTAGSVVVFAPLPGWTINVSTGLSTPVLGSASLPELDLNSVNVSSAAGGWLDIELTDTGFTAQNAAHIAATIGGTTSGSVSYRTYLDSSNTAFGQDTLLTSFDSVGSPFANAASNTLSSATLYSLTLLVRITHAAQQGGQATSFDATVKVPEPGTLLLLGAGCLALVPLMRRRRLRPAEVFT